MRTIKQVQLWGKLTGIASILYGIGSSILLSPLSFVYILPGLISIFIGGLLYHIGRQARVADQSEDDSVEAVFPVIRSYSTLLMVLGIVIGISLICFIIFYGYIWIGKG